MTLRRKYVLPIALAFAGMFVCHFLILAGFGSGIHFPIYILTYPLQVRTRPLVQSQIIVRKELSA